VDVSEQPSGEDFDLAAAGLRLDGADVAGSTEVLAAKLEQALPGRVSVRRGGGGLLGKGPKRVREVRLELGNCQYELQIEGERMRGWRGRQVGGIAIKREELDAGSWLAALTSDLREEAQRSSEARAALERLLG
jgi:hypothetical protein